MWRSSQRKKTNQVVARVKENESLDFRKKMEGVGEEMGGREEMIESQF